MLPGIQCFNYEVRVDGFVYFLGAEDTDRSVKIRKVMVRVDSKKPPLWQRCLRPEVRKKRCRYSKKIQRLIAMWNIA